MESLTYKFQRGFTIIELIMVIVIVAILAASAIFTFNNSQLYLDSQSEMLARDLRYTQMLAMTRNARYRLRLDNASSPKGYIIETSSGATASTVVSNPTNLPSNMTITLTGLPSNYVLFDSVGRPYKDNTTLLDASGATITLNYNGQQKAITITQETGSISP